MNPLKHALTRLWAHKLVWLEVTLLLAAALAAFDGWLLLPVATGWHVALNLLTALAILALLTLAVRVAIRSFSPLAWPKAAATPAFWLALLIWLAAGLWLPYRLIWWIPTFQSLPAQAASAACRFLLAGTLFTGALLWLALVTKPPQTE